MRIKALFFTDDIERSVCSLRHIPPIPLEHTGYILARLYVSLQWFCFVNLSSCGSFSNARAVKDGQRERTRHIFVDFSFFLPLRAVSSAFEDTLPASPCFPFSPLFRLFCPLFGCLCEGQIKGSCYLQFTRFSWVWALFQEG
jgi:hypothetical protein